MENPENYKLEYYNDRFGKIVTENDFLDYEGKIIYGKLIKTVVHKKDPCLVSSSTIRDFEKKALQCKNLLFNFFKLTNLKGRKTLRKRI